MNVRDKVPFGDLLLDSKDGEWGEGAAGVGLVAADMIRGTDFAELNSPAKVLPRRYVNEKHAARKRLQVGDIVFEMAGGTAKQSTGRSALITKTFLEQRADTTVLCASFCRHLRLDQAKYDPQYVYFVLQALYGAGYMGVFNIQHTGVSRFQYTSFKKHTVLEMPKLATQQKIAAILSAYDDLIANNQRRITLLEDMAEDVYREWFVRLRFPGHENVPIEKGMPQRWTYAEIGTVCSTLKRGVAPNYSDSQVTLVVNQRCIRGGFVDLTEARGHETKVLEEKLLRYGDVLINSTGVGTLGRVAVFDLELSNATCDTHVSICRAKPEAVGIHYFGHAIKSLQTHFENLAVGSTGQSELGREAISRTIILQPPLETQMDFEKAVDPMLRKMRLLRRQVADLAKQRDALLPRLISGKLSVDTLDIRFPPA